MKVEVRFQISAEAAEVFRRKVVEILFPHQQEYRVNEHYLPGFSRKELIVDFYILGSSNVEEQTWTVTIVEECDSYECTTEIYGIYCGDLEEFDFCCAVEYGPILGVIGPFGGFIGRNALAAYSQTAKDFVRRFADTLPVNIPRPEPGFHPTLVRVWFENLAVMIREGRVELDVSTWWRAEEFFRHHEAWRRSTINLRILKELGERGVRITRSQAEALLALLLAAYEELKHNN